MKESYRKICNYLAERLKERSTWHGINILLTAAGVVLNPAQQQAMIVMGSVVSALILVVTEEKTK